MSRTFEHFPDTAVCPICATNADGPCVLIPIDGTQDGDCREAKPVHAECVDVDRMRYSVTSNVVYVIGDERYD